MSLLDKAKELDGGRGAILTKDECELAIAFVKDEISFSAVGKAMGKDLGSSPYILTTKALRQLYREGKLTFKN